MLIPVHSPAKGKLKVVGYVSGSGNTLWKAYELQKEMEKTPEGCPFEIVGIFADNPQSKAVETAKTLGVPCVAIDIRQYYADRNKPLKDRQVRQEYDREALALIEPFGGDIIVLAGYVWATTDDILDRYTLVNVHPGDLSVMKDGHRAYAGADGVGSALKAGESNLHATSHLATKVVDGGPILVISPGVPVDYKLHEQYEDRFRHYLKLVNDQNRLVGARTILELALGNFATDQDGRIYYKGEPCPTGMRLANWDENKPIHERETSKLFAPKSVAVIGASQKPGIGRAVMQNLISENFPGNLYAVNVRAEEVLGAPGYASVSDIPGELDMAVITIPSAAVLKVAEECGQKGVKALVCISAGFKEVDEAGAKAEKELLAIVNRYNMRMIGPNCMGLLNSATKLNATILTGQVARGNVALVSQSGAIGAAMLDFAEEIGLGFSSMISLGNQADINVCDLLPLLEGDPQTKVVILYLESILNPVRLVNYASKMTKPVLVIKSGRTDVGARAASSHTGSLAGNDSTADALMYKAGLKRMDSIEECFISAAALANMPQLNGKRVALVTNAGGPGTLITDALIKAGFEMPMLSEVFQAKLAEQLMKEASTKNPVDVVAPAPPQHYVAAAQAMVDSGQYDALLICCVPPATVDTAEVAKVLAPTLKKAGMPVLSCFFGPTLGYGARQVMREQGIPTYTFPEQVAVGLSGLVPQKSYPPEQTPRLAKDSWAKAAAIVSGAPLNAYLPNEEACALLDAFGIEVAKNVTVKNSEATKGLNLRYPVVAKIDHPEILHKSDVGGVILGLKDQAELARTVDALLAKFPGAKGVFVQEMLPKGLELIVGSASDASLGQSLMVGLGGTMVEVFKDVVFAYPPVSLALAEDMISRLKCLPLLSGFRGQKGVDLNRLAHLLVKVGALLAACPAISELDLNPIIYDENRQDFAAADFRIKIG